MNLPLGAADVVKFVKAVDTEKLQLQAKSILKVTQARLDQCLLSVLLPS